MKVHTPVTLITLLLSVAACASNRGRADDPQTLIGILEPVGWRTTQDSIRLIIGHGLGDNAGRLLAFDLPLGEASSLEDGAPAWLELVALEEAEPPADYAPLPLIDRHSADAADLSALSDSHEFALAHHAGNPVLRVYRRSLPSGPWTQVGITELPWVEPPSGPTALEVLEFAAEIAETQRELDAALEELDDGL